jgi:hypothetical protein
MNEIDNFRTEKDLLGMRRLPRLPAVNELKMINSPQIILRVLCALCGE